MAYRFPPIPPSELTSEQKEAQEILDETTSKFFGENGSVFNYKDKDGGYVGPMAPLLRTPSFIKPYFDLMVALAQIPGLPARCRELAILAVGSVYKSAYELYAHSKVAELKTDFSHEQVVAARSGKTPEGLTSQEKVAYEVALKLAGQPGNLDPSSYEAAKAELGEQGYLALAHYVGAYAWTCVLLNAAAVPAEGEY